MDLPLARAELDRAGYVVLQAAVPPATVQAALRLLMLTVRREGLTREQVLAWQPGTFFPHLRWEPAVWDVLPDGAAELLGWQPGDDWAEPQLLVRLPDEDEPWPVVPHVDTPPDWAGPGSYLGIVGVALTDAGEQDGTVCVWPGSHRGELSEPVMVPLSAGDALVMHPLLQHAGTLNLGATLRTAVYFRLVHQGAEKKMMR